MINATDTQYDTQIINILTHAFADNKSVNYVIRQDQHRMERIRRLMQYAVDTCHDFGKVWLSEDQKACALVLLPDSKRATTKAIKRDFRLATAATGLMNVRKTWTREARIKAKHPETPYCHLWFMAVETGSQGQGLGSNLLKFLVDLYQLQQRPIYLETSTERNLPWYKKSGFEVYDQLDFTFPLYLLRNPL